MMKVDITLEELRKMDIKSEEKLDILIQSLDDNNEIDEFIEYFIEEHSTNYLKSADKNSYLMKILRTKCNLNNVTFYKLFKTIEPLIKQLVNIKIMDEVGEVEEMNEDMINNLLNEVELKPYKSKFDNFSNKILSGGWRDETTYCVIADSNTGKTYFVFTEMLHLALEHDKKIAIFETDMSLKRTMQYLKQAYINLGYEEDLFAANVVKHFVFIPTATKDGRPINIEEIDNYLPSDVDFLVMDLVNNMSSMNAKDEYSLLQELAIRINALRKGKNISIIAISVKNKSEDSEPSLRNIKGNVNFGYSFDTVFDISDIKDRRRPDRKFLRFTNLKNRDGLNGDTSEMWLTSNDGFKEVTGDELMFDIIEAETSSKTKKKYSYK